MELKLPSHPRYSLESARLRSFDSWPKGLAQKPEDMADAGLFYTGQSDKVRCYFCNGGLKDWSSGDQPWEEHARYFQKCSYVLFVKGENYVRSVKNRNIIKGENVEYNKVIEQFESLSVDTNNYKNMTCTICLTEELCMCFIPCGHAVTCAKCMLSLKNTCSVCREPISKALRLYF